MSLRDEIARAIKAHVQCDATGLSPGIASAFLVGFDAAADAILPIIERVRMEEREKCAKVAQRFCDAVLGIRGEQVAAAIRAGGAGV